MKGETNMKTIALSFFMAAIAVSAAPSAGHAKVRSDKAAQDGVAESAPPAGLDKEETEKWRAHMLVKTHIRKHVKYPAQKSDVLIACKGKREAKAADMKWVEATLPDKTYDTAKDVEEALGWEKEAPTAPTAATGEK